jgi:amino acid transporter
LNQLGLTAPQASIIPAVAITQFVVLVTAGVALRRRASLHKRFMLLAVTSVLSPASARLTALLGLREYMLLIQMGVIAVFVIVCLVYDWRKNRVVHPVFAIGGVVLILLWPARYAIARSEMWQPVGEWIAKAGQRLSTDRRARRGQAAVMTSVGSTGI